MPAEGHKHGSLSGTGEGAVCDPYTKQKLLGLGLAVPQFLHHHLEQFESDFDPHWEPSMPCTGFYKKYTEWHKGPWNHSGGGRQP